MTKEEYDSIQRAFNHHLQMQKMYAPLNSNEWLIYERAVMGCKSVLSNFAPDKEGKH